MQCRYAEIAQRIFACSDKQYTSLTPDKILNSLIYRPLFYVNMQLELPTFKKQSGFLAHPVHLPTSPVHCSHFTLGNPKKSLFTSTTSVYILNQAYCMIYSGHLWFLTVMTAWGLFLSHCIKLLVTCYPSSTTMCHVMHDIVWCVSLYISVYLCLCLPDWRINVFIIHIYICGRFLAHSVYYNAPKSQTICINLRTYQKGQHYRSQWLFPQKNVFERKEVIFVVQRLTSKYLQQRVDKLFILHKSNNSLELSSLYSRICEFNQRIKYFETVTHI